MIRGVIPSIHYHFSHASHQYVTCSESKLRNSPGQNNHSRQKQTTRWKYYFVSIIVPVHEYTGSASLVYTVNTLQLSISLLLGLFTADQKLAGERSIYTRQNPTGTRRGYECPEERDYYPYWHPTEWKDIAVLTSEPSRCEYYTKESFNVKPKGECHYDEYWVCNFYEPNGYDWLQILDLQYSFLDVRTVAQSVAWCWRILAKVHYCCSAAGCCHCIDVAFSLAFCLFWQHLVLTPQLETVVPL